jgi:hypothetical protein
VQPMHITFIEVVLMLFCAIVASTQFAYADDVTRLQDRWLQMYSSLPGATTKYKFNFTHATYDPVGSIEFKACVSPIPDDPCTVFTGLSFANATLVDQTGQTGYHISFKSVNRIVLTRDSGVPEPVDGTPATYTFDNIHNPTRLDRSFGVRMSTHTSMDATDPLPYINLGSVIGNATPGQEIITQVPPILTFCLGGQVDLDCNLVAGGNYTDMGDLSPTRPLYAQSEMAAGTNAPGGFAITVNGTTMQAGTNTIKRMDVPAPSRPGTQQFGLNLRANTDPQIGADFYSPWPSTLVPSDYNTPNQYKFKNGDLVATSTDVALSSHYTVSYIVNAPDDLKAGIYTTTLTYICSGRF